MKGPPPLAGEGQPAQRLGAGVKLVGRKGKPLLGSDQQQQQQQQLPPVSRCADAQRPTGSSAYNPVLQPAVSLPCDGGLQDGVVPRGGTGRRCACARPGCRWRIAAVIAACLRSGVLVLLTWRARPISRQANQPAAVTAAALAHSVPLCIVLPGTSMPDLMQHSIALCAGPCSLGPATPGPA